MCKSSKQKDRDTTNQHSPPFWWWQKQLIAQHVLFFLSSKNLWENFNYEIKLLKFFWTFKNIAQKWKYYQFKTFKQYAINPTFLPLFDIIKKHKKMNVNSWRKLDFIFSNKNFQKQLVPLTKGYVDEKRIFESNLGKNSFFPFVLQSINP